IQLAESVDGQIVQITPTSNQRINPFALPNSATKQEIHQHIEDSISLLSVMAGHMTVEERAAVDGALNKLFRTARRQVGFSQVITAIKRHDSLHGLIERLEPFISGSLQELFATTQTLQLEAPLT